MLQIFIVCLFAFVFVWYFGQRVSNVGDSMNPILYNGDTILVNRLSYNVTIPKRGDIVVFKPNGNENSHFYVKRLIGLPGETVEIKEGKIYINGKQLKETYDTTEIVTEGVAKEPVKLSGEEYFVLGDNRSGSEDSRDADVGNVKRPEIFGKVWFVLAPSKHFGWIKK